MCTVSQTQDMLTLSRTFTSGSLRLVCMCVCARTCMQRMGMLSLQFHILPYIFCMRASGGGGALVISSQVWWLPLILVLWFKKKVFDFGDGGVAQLVECLPSVVA